MDIVLIRHTRPLAPSGLCYGQLDLALAATSINDIATTLAAVAPVTAVFSSPLQRCALLGQALAHRDSVPLTLVPELQELSFGEWEGKLWSDVPREASDPWAEDPWTRAPPGGETEQALWTRVDDWQRRALQQARERIAVVAHGGSLRILRCILLRQPSSQHWSWQLDQGAVVTLTLSS